MEFIALLLYYLLRRLRPVGGVDAARIFMDADDPMILFQLRVDAVVSTF